MPYFLTLIQAKPLLFKVSENGRVQGIISEQLTKVTGCSLNKQPVIVRFADESVWICFFDGTEIEDCQLLYRGQNHGPMYISEYSIVPVPGLKSSEDVLFRLAQLQADHLDISRY